LQDVSCIVCFGRDIYYKAIQHFRFSCTKLSIYFGNAGNVLIRIKKVKVKVQQHTKFGCLGENKFSCHNFHSVLGFSFC